ncbi:MAG: hypothetical protein KIT22_06380 [Verrucomicrobiae bacterium]|nr:hypothetical protein [Verrucomicrobiae bacterium]
MFDDAQLIPLSLDAAEDINDAGVVVGSSQQRAATWSDGVVSLLNLDESFGNLVESTARAINSSGQIAGILRYGSKTSSQSWERGFLWLNGSTTLVGPVEGQFTRLVDINDSGVAVGNVETSFERRAVIYRDGELIDLNALIPSAGWVLEEAQAINNAGQIVGLGSLNGVAAAFLLNPLLPGDPVPPSIVQQPQGGEYPLGATATLTVVASGTGPLTYQWQRRAIDLDGETNTVLTLSGLTGAADGDYRVVVRNAAGEAYSQPATIVVHDPATSIARYTGLTIQGTVGGQYRIESAPDMASSEWSFAGYVTLTNTAQIWFDVASYHPPPAIAG